MDAKDIHNLEQGAAMLKEHFIPSLRSFYEGLIENGFNEQQALYLTNNYMIGLLMPEKHTDG